MAYNMKNILVNLSGNSGGGGGGGGVIKQLQEDVEELQNDVAALKANGYVIDTLYEYEELPTPASGSSEVTHDFQLPEDLDKYDELLIYAWAENKNGTAGQLLSYTLVKELYYIGPATTSRFVHLLNGSIGNATKRFMFRIDQETKKMLTVATRAESANEPTLYKVYGKIYPKEET